MPPMLRQTVLDTTDVRRLAEFYRRLLGLRYRPGDEPPDAEPPGWLVLRDGDRSLLAFQRVGHLPRPTWPAGEHPQMLHLDLTVPDVPTLEAERRRVGELGGTELADRSDDPEEPLYVFADPSGHPFCIFVAH